MLDGVSQSYRILSADVRKLAAALKEIDLPARRDTLTG
jgi:hypothetical protein